MKLYLRILSYLRPHLWAVVSALGFTFLYAILNAAAFVLLIPFLENLFEVDTGGGGGATALPQQDLLDRGLDWIVGLLVDPSTPKQEAIFSVVLLLFGVYLLKSVFDLLSAYLISWTQQAVNRDLRNQVYSHLLDLDLAFFGRVKAGQIISRLTYDVEQLRTLVTRELGRLIRSVFEALGAVVMMAAISGKLTLAAFVAVPGTMIIFGPLVRRLRRGDRKVLDLAGEINSHIQETVTGIRLVKASASEQHERGRFRGLVDRFFRTAVRTEGVRAAAQPITEMLAAIGTAVLLLYGGYLVLGESADPLNAADFISFLGLSMLLYSPVKYIGRFPALIQPGLVGAERVFEFLDAPIEIIDQPDAREFPGVNEKIAYENVSFQYRDDLLVLKGVDFTVPRGSVIALVGPSGAGKTTVVDLLGRFYEVTSGRIAIDGTDIREFSLQSLRNALGIVSQETVLFHDTVEANIRYGAGVSSREAVEEAARAAHAHEFILGLPDGYQTVVGERGTELSGGQRQRIAIARALLRDPPILIFDEATSSLDSESERLVQQAVERLMEGRTVFVIAHRLSTVQRADQILVLREGEVVERGTHASLIERGGFYTHLYTLQFSAEAVLEGANVPEAG